MSTKRVVDFLSKSLTFIQTPSLRKKLFSVLRLNLSGKSYYVIVHDLDLLIGTSKSKLELTTLEPKSAT